MRQKGIDEIVWEKGTAAAPVSASRLACRPAGSMFAALASSSFLVIKKESHLIGGFSFFRAGKGTRTLDPDLGKVVLYQLSYSRGVAQL